MAEKIAQALKANTSLIYLRLYSHNITHKGAKAIAQALAKHTNLKYLHLGKNEIKCEGAIAIAEALKVNKTLEELSLWENGIRSEGIKALAEAIESNDTLKKLHLSTRARCEISSIDADTLYKAIHKRGQKFNCRSDMKYGLAEGEKQDCFIILDKGYIPQ